jgi:cobalt-zinc-cadmium efflux system membrane fusion protein
MKGVWIAAALILTGCGKTIQQAEAVVEPVATSSGRIEIPPDSPKLKQIRVATVEIRDLPLNEFLAPADIEVNPNRVAKVLLPAPGRVAEVLVRFGDAVEKDQTLLLIESPEAEAAASNYLHEEQDVAQARATVLKARADLERVRMLYEGDAIARKEVVAAETELAHAEASLKQAEAAMQQAAARLALLGLKPGSVRQRIAVRAPLSGKITEMTVVAGEYRSDLAEPLMTIADLSTVWVSADVPESSIRFVKVGEQFDVTLAAFPGEVLKSRVARIADSVDPQTRTIEVWAELKNPDGRLRPSMFGQVRHVEDYRKVAAIPVSAPIEAQGRTVVYREVSAGVFEEVQVKLGQRSGEWIPVEEGLSPGDRIVVDGVMLLRGAAPKR